MGVPRRSILHLVSIGVVTSVAGCSATVPNTESPNSASTEPSLGTPMQPVPVTFSAEVLRQATDEHPPRLRAHLENRSSGTVRVGFGPALLFTDDAASDDLEWADQLVIDPETFVGPWDEPTRSDEGCWRFPEDGSRLVQSILSWHDLSPSDSLTETYDVYTYGTAGPCLPEGTYQFQDKGHLEDEAHALLLTLSLQIDSDQQLTVNAEETGASND